MKNRTKEVVQKKTDDVEVEKISRKDALKKTGYYAFSAATMMILLSNPNKAQAASPGPAAPPRWSI
ncbi:hypothetical protein [Gaoshiqia sp. Z1-71]|uniref:hypothetical protein n=1 Tax=Gaoshiqia hydrogeniformans TaxID=3290090 RepID=UPI003BF7AD24